MSQTAGGTTDVGKRMQGVRTIYDLDARFRMMDPFDDYTQILSLGLPPLEGMVGPDKTPEFARAANDGLAELVAKYPDRFAGYVGALPMDNPDAAVKEAERILLNGNANGLQLHTNVNGACLDEPRFLPIFEVAAKSGKPILLHPARKPDIPGFSSREILQVRDLDHLRLAVRNQRHHGPPDLLRRHDKVSDAQSIGASSRRHGPVLRRPHRHRVGDPGQPDIRRGLQRRAGAARQAAARVLPNFYGDTALCGGRIGTVCGLEFYGVDHVLFASDAPFGPEGGAGYIRSHHEGHRVARPSAGRQGEDLLPQREFRFSNHYLPKIRHERI